MYQLELTHQVRLSRLSDLAVFILILGTFLASCTFAQQENASQKKSPHAIEEADSEEVSFAEKEGFLLSGTRQLTFEGRRAGEGYFSRDGSQLVFQSEREPGNPFFQIYVMDRETGDVQRVSPGKGKTTCAWIHPEGNKVLFASTHEDPKAEEKQREEIALRQSGKQKRYAWDYDEEFEIYEFDRQAETYRALTDARGYDAEASWSPDGRLVAFTSNRLAYSQEMTAEQRRQFEFDPAAMNDIFIMDADGKNVRQLTTSLGYDGGPFFSPDGKRICWRRFSVDGATAEVWTMNIDGSDKRQLTRLAAMSWAPFYHPSGQYLIFTTNRHGFANFELYLIDVEGKSSPVRVTYTKGFDGLPVFTPDGKQLVWTTNRTAAKQSQLFVANWDHSRALKLLGLETSTAKLDSPDKTPKQKSSQAHDAATTAAARKPAQLAHQSASVDYLAVDAQRHVEYLCRDELEGRLTGSKGERLATAYVAAYLELLGLEPAGDDGSWFQEFEFTSGVALGSDNLLAVGKRNYQVDEDWRPLSFSATGEFESAPLVFAGYGIVAEKSDQQEAYDSYVHLDVKDKWVVVFRYLPEDVSPEKRQQLSRPSQLRFKATFARQRGARGMIVVTGPNAQARNELVGLKMDGILAGSSLPVISVSNEVADAWLNKQGKSLKQLQDQLDTGKQSMGFDIEDVQLSAEIDIKRIRKTGRNVLGRLPADDNPHKQTIVVGAHIDHLGRGASSSSLARGDEASLPHYGADDNASGVAAMLEIAEHLAHQRKQKGKSFKRDLLFAAWSGEELGLLGSDHFVKALAGHKSASHEKHSAENSHAKQSIYPGIAACLNMDMVGRLDKNVVLQGIGSSPFWRSAIERRNAVVGLPVALQEDSYLPTDASSFYLHGVPILSAFTGAHRDYHTPRDTPDKINYEGLAQIARFMGLVARGLATTDELPAYVQQSVEKKTTDARLRVYLGTIPDYAEEVKGVLLSGVSKDGPADKAGLTGRDIIVELAGQKIENIYDYTHAIEGLKVGETVKIAVVRNGKRVELEITPSSRD